MKVERVKMAELNTERHIVVTGGAGYLGSLLIGKLLHLGYAVTAVDDLLYGGESLLAYFSHPNFHFVKANVCEPRSIRNTLNPGLPSPEAVVHLAGIVGFPACQAVGRQVAWRYNVESTERVFEQSIELGVGRFLFASTYSIYGPSLDGTPLTENSPINPGSLYAETMFNAEKLLLGQKDSNCIPVVFRMAHLYGLSPRPRFDLMVNQFVLDAYTKREMVIYQRGYSRSFMHVRDAVEGLILGLNAADEVIRGQIYNLGSETGNITKDDIAQIILTRLPETTVRYKDLTFGGDMRDFQVSYKKVQENLDFNIQFEVEDGVREVLQALHRGIIDDPKDHKYRNAQFIVA
jgi:nucleoside-diphosphate-sugar epimerase